MENPDADHPYFAAQVKIKAHCGEDTRVILVSTGIDYDDLTSRLKEKFGFRRNVRCKIRDDDGDGMISLTDQEDLDIAIASSKKAARRDHAEYGKLEVRLLPLFKSRYIHASDYVLTENFAAVGG